MPKQTGYEDDWINALNGVSNLANTLTRTKAQGLQIKEAESEADRKRRELAVANRMTTGLQRGETPEQLAGLQFAPGPGWAGDYNQINKGAPQNDRVAPEDFTRSSDRVGSSEVAAGLSNSLQTKTAIDDETLNQTSAKYKTELAGKSFEELMNLRENVGQFGKDALAVNMAIEDLSENHAKTEQYSAIKMENRKKNIDDMATRFKAGLSQYQALRQSGNAKAASEILIDIADNANLLPQKAEILPNGNIRKYITVKGKPSHDFKEYTPDQFYDFLSGIDDKTFYTQNYLSAEVADQLRRDSFKKPDLFTNGKDALRVVMLPKKRPGDKFKVEAYGPNGKIEGVESFEQLYASGFYPAKEGGDKNMDVAGAKYLDEQTKKAMFTDLINKSLPFQFDPNSGEYVATRDLTPSEQSNANTIMSKYGQVPALAKKVDKHWYKADDVSYGYSGYGPGKRRGASGPPPATNLEDSLKKNLLPQEAEKPATVDPRTQASMDNYTLSKYFPGIVSNSSLDIAYKRKIAEAIQAGQPKPEGVPDADWQSVMDEMTYLNSMTRGLSLRK